MVRAFLLLTVFIFLTGCAQKHKLAAYPSLVTNEDPNATSNTRMSIQGEMLSEYDQGLYITDFNEVYVKTDGRSIISLIDELAYKNRLNYTVLTSLPKARLALFNAQDADKPWQERRAMKFKTFTDFFAFLQTFMNYQSQYDDNNVTNYNITLNDDGVLIKSSVKDYSSSYKKIFLYNLTVSEAQASIQEFFFKDGTTPYSSVPIQAQNALIVKADPTKLSEIGEIIHAIDSDSPQVMIESQVFEYDDTIGRKIGTALDYSFSGDDLTYGVKTVFGEGITDALPQMFGNYDNVERKQALLAALALQDRDGGVKIMAEPRLVLKPGKEAYINLNTLKYVIVSGVNYSDLKEIQTGIVFKITPTILSDSTILLNIHLEQSEFIPTNEDDIVQSVNKNVVDTSIVVNDGELVSIGGIYMEKSSDFASGIPYLREIPVVGYLFGSEASDSSRMMIEFMIRPTIKKLYSRSEMIRDRTINIYHNQFEE